MTRLCEQAVRIPFHRIRLEESRGTSGNMRKKVNVVSKVYLSRLLKIRVLSTPRPDTSTFPHQPYRSPNNRHLANLTTVDNTSFPIHHPFIMPSSDTAFKQKFKNCNNAPKPNTAWNSLQRVEVVLAMTAVVGIAVAKSVFSPSGSQDR